MGVAPRAGVECVVDMEGRRRTNKLYFSKAAYKGILITLELGRELKKEWRSIKESFQNGSWGIETQRWHSRRRNSLFTHGIYLFCYLFVSFMSYTSLSV